MITTETKTKVSAIETESYEMKKFRELNSGATVSQQIAALESDRHRKWPLSLMTNNMMDRLIGDLGRLIQNSKADSDMSASEMA